MIGLDEVQTLLATLGMVSVGFYVGSLYTGIQAQATYIGSMPDWMQAVKTVQGGILVVFALSVIGATAIERHKVNNEGV